MNSLHTLDGRWQSFHQETVKEVNALLEHPVIERLRLGGFQLDELKALAVERYKVARRLESLLQRGLQIMHRDRVVHDLQRVFIDNLNDELGHAEDRVNGGVGGHEPLRQDFLRNLGVSEEDLIDLDRFFSRANSHIDFQSYESASGQYFSDTGALYMGTSYKIAGAAYLGELFVPGEFQAYKNAINGVQILPATSSGFAYLDVHINHDTARHAPELLNALSHGNEEDCESATEGMRIMSQARKTFYDRVQAQLLA